MLVAQELMEGRVAAVEVVQGRPGQEQVDKATMGAQAQPTSAVHQVVVAQAQLVVPVEPLLAAAEAMARALTRVRVEYSAQAVAVVEHKRVAVAAVRAEMVAVAMEA